MAESTMIVNDSLNENLGVWVDVSSHFTKASGITVGTFKASYNSALKEVQLYFTYENVPNGSVIYTFSDLVPDDTSLSNYNSDMKIMYKSLSYVRYTASPSGSTPFQIITPYYTTSKQLKLYYPTASNGYGSVFVQYTVS